ncbi:MAG: 30S ribosomal protein S17 [Candidatus Eisenbacteria bacterium]
MEQRGQRKTREGFVISSAMNKTIVVTLRRQVPHPVYGKYVSRDKKFYAHDERDECRVGDYVRIMETRPLSKMKRWRVTDILKRAE